MGRALKDAAIIIFVVIGLAIVTLPQIYIGAPLVGPYLALVAWVLGVWFGVVGTRKP